MTEVISINAVNPEPHKIRRVVEVLNGDGVIAYPTETVYGLGCRFDCEIAIKRVYELKGRDFRKPLSLIVADRKHLNSVVLEVSPMAESLMNAFWPGPVSLVLNAMPTLISSPSAQGSTIAVRVPRNQICLDILKECGVALVSTSANPSGERPITTAPEVSRFFEDKLDLIIDGGPTPGTVPSTVVDVSQHPVKILREGVVSEDEIRKVLCE